MAKSAGGSTIQTHLIVGARVLRCAPAGLIIDLGQGREGLVREREIAWDAEARRGWRQHYQPGQSVQVVPLKETHGARPEFSLRLAHHDPWLHAGARFPVGGVAEGVVTGAMPYGVFVELEPGVSGLVHSSRFPAWEKRRPEEIFWPGDLVNVVVRSVDLVRRRIALSLVEIATIRWPVHGASVAPAPPREGPALSPPRQSSMRQLLARPRQRVLVVEDDLVQRRAVADWLQYANQIVEQAGGGEEAWEAYARTEPDLVLMDIGLPDVNGIEIARRFLASGRQSRCVLMTDWGRAEIYPRELGELAAAGVSLMLKPLLPEDLLNALLETTPTIVLPHEKLQARARIEEIASTPRLAQKSTLLGYLAELRAAVAADQVVLFELDSDAQQITVYAQHGAQELRLDAAEVIYSPVYAVAELGRFYMVHNAKKSNDLGLQHLHSVLEFGACLGVPAPASLQHRYALFLFFDEETAISSVWLSQARITAGAVGLWLERQHFTIQAANMLRVAMLGQLARAMVHEISGRLTPVNLAIERLQTECDALEDAASRDPAQVSRSAQHARQELHNLLQQTQALTKTTRSFSRMARSGQEEILILQDIIDEAVEILHDTSAAAHVAVLVHPVPRLYLTRVQVTYFQQVLVNVLQNAIQQIRQFRPGQPGRVEVRLSQTAAANRPTLQVKIEDDGPGIHRRLWERVFEADYTTRPDGSGLGLYISRSLIESQGGRIYVDDSRLYWGSVFVVELPIRM